MSEQRVLVVGAGAAGLMTALELAKRGVEKVTVIDKDYPASASSGLSGGVFNRQTPNRRELEMRSYGVGFFVELERSGKLELLHNGYIRVARTETDIRHFEEAVELHRRVGVEDSRVVDTAEIEKLVPGIYAGDWAGGLYGPSDGCFDGHLLCGCYLELGEAEGVEFRPRTCLQGIEETADGLRAETDRGPIDCDVIVNGAGAWAPEVAAMMGLRMAVHNLPTSICIAHLAEPLRELPPTVNSYVPDSGPEKGLWFRPESADRMLVGVNSHEASGVSADPDDYARGVALDYVELLAELLQERVPGWPELRLEEGWTGLYPTSPDGVFQVGPHPGDPRMVAAGGLNGVGLTVSPAIGRIAAEWITEGKSNAFSFADDLLPERDSLAVAEPVG